MWQVSPQHLQVLASLQKCFYGLFTRQMRAIDLKNISTGTPGYYSSPCHWTHSVNACSNLQLASSKKKKKFEWKIRVRWQSLDHAVPFLIDYKPQNALIAPGHLARVKGMSTNKHKINAAWWSTMTSITTGSLSNKWVITQGQTTGCCSCQRCWEVTTSSSSTVPSFFFSLKILQSKFPFYCNELKVIVQFNSGVWCTMKSWRMEQRKHQNNSNSRSKVSVRCGHPKCIINTALSLATIYSPHPGQVMVVQLCRHHNIHHCNIWR